MPKAIKINDSVKQMKLNADNRRLFTKAILSDALQTRSEHIRLAMYNLTQKLIERTFGDSPQKRASIHKRTDKLEADIKALRDKGIHVSGAGIGRTSDSLDLNLNGLNICLRFIKKDFYVDHTIDFDTEYLKRHYDAEQSQKVGTDSLILKQGDKLAEEFWALKEEAAEIKHASDELTAILNTVLGKSKSLGQALEKWPELSQYVPQLLSASREIIVPIGTLNARLDALKAGKLSAKKAAKLRD